MTREEIKKLAQDVSNEINSLNLSGKMYTTLKYNENKYRSGKPVKFGEPVNIFTDSMYEDEDENDDQEYFNSFSMYLMENKNRPEGGFSDNNNMCFYNCIHDILKNNCPWSDGVKFKRWLNISVGDKVKISHIQQIEEYIKVSINIKGDYFYFTTLKNCNKIINLKLIDEHYILDITNTPEHNNNNRKISFSDKQPIIYDATSFMCYDGKKEFFLTKEQRNNIYSWKTSNILINKSSDKLTLQDEYLKFIQDANILKNETKGNINLFRTGGNKTTALNLFYNFNKHIKVDNIKQVEAEFINKSSHGALMYSEKGIFDNIYKYDVVSMYPSIMASGQMFPIREGELKNINKYEFNKNNFVPFGIYRCIIKGTNKLFKFNKHNFYTHIDIKQARELNLYIELVEDKEPNFLYYSREKLITGNEIFKQYVEELFELKHKGIKQIKPILNILWGALTETKTKTILINNNDKNIITISGNIKVLKFSNFKEDKTIIEYVNNV